MIITEHCSVIFISTIKIGEPCLVHSESSSLNHLDLTGKRYVITGGSSGAGQATVEFLASHGAEVITSGRDVDRGRKISNHSRAMYEIE